MGCNTPRARTVRPARTYLAPLRGRAPIALVALHFVALPALAATPPPLKARTAAVASDHAAASAAGVEALRAGGNAVDAACATALALGVVNPHASGIGGGGFALVYLAQQRKTHVLDFREQAPAASKPELYQKDGKPQPELSRRGGLAVAVPGEVRGLAALVERFGKRGFAACVRPAERLANGFAAGPRLVRAVDLALRPSSGAILGSAQPVDPATAAQAEARTRGFLGQVLRHQGSLAPGSMVKRPALAATLRTLRTAGPEAFYRGPIARAIVAAVQAAGGVMTLEDLAGYKVKDRTPLALDYRGFQVVTMPPPSSGGVVIAEALGILGNKVPDPTRLPRAGSAQLHLVLEALKHGFADRARWLGDSDFVEVPLARLLSAAYHRELAARVDDRAVLPLDRYGSGAGGASARDGGTAHLSVVDGEGNAVALTTTVNTGFGAHVIAGPTGIVLNNQMDDFSLAPGTANAFGLLGNSQNAIAPGKRPLSSMSPTIVLEGDRVKLVVGASGGPTIISGTLQVMLNVLDGKLDAQAASAAPRVHHQWQPDLVLWESEIAPDVRDGLTRRGHKLMPEPRDGLTLVNLIVRTEAGLEAAAEFRGGGAPAGY